MLPEAVPSVEGFPVNSETPVSRMPSGVPVPVAETLSFHLISCRHVARTVALSEALTSLGGGSEATCFLSHPQLQPPVEGTQGL